MYRIEANLENRFPDLKTALAAFSKDIEVMPVLPATRNEREDSTTPRICVAPTLEDCITGIGVLGRFRRTLSGNEEAFSYAVKGNEAYPVIVLEFDDDGVYAPTVEQVFDVEMTHERWFLTPKKPKRVRLRWLGMYSVYWKSDDECRICKKVRFLRSPKGYDHPWLNGKGHILESSRREDEPQDEIKAFEREEIL